MYDKVFSEYKNYMLLDNDHFTVKDDTFYKDKLYINNDFYYTLSNPQQQNLKSIIELEKKTNYKDNDKVGINKIYIGSKLIHSEDIYISKQKEPKKPWWKKLFGWFL